MTNAPSSSRADGGFEVDVAVIGAGPAGLNAAPLPAEKRLTITGSNIF